MKVCNVCRARFKGNPKTCPLDGTVLAELGDPLLGRTIAGRYVILEKIGSGGMGTVYRAQLEAVGREVALKFLSPDLALDTTNRTRFLREAKAANRIQHEHIIAINDFGETEDGLVFLAMELLVGKTLGQAISSSSMSIRRAIAITLQVASALARAHELDVVHRDIKPENIYLITRPDRQDFVKLLDFGLAQMKGEMKLTATGTVFGTPEYLSPEQARGLPHTPQVDLYALGCVLFEMVTGRIPFEGDTSELIMQHIRTAPPVPSSIRDEIPQELDRVILKLLEKDPAMRHKDAHHLIEDLRRVSDLATREMQVHSNPPWSMPPPAPSAGKQALHAASPSHRTFSNDDGWWGERVALFRELLARAHPDGSTPANIAQALQILTAEALRMREARLEMEMCGASAASTEEKMREARLRIGRALDELARDESRVSRELGEVELRLDDATAQLQAVAAPVQKKWERMREVAEVTRELIDSLRDMGPVAAAWVELERAESVLRRDAEERRRELEDLRFQTAQLKGRLGTLNAEAEMELGDLRERGSRSEALIRSCIETLVATAGPVVQHLMAFPALRAIVLGETGPNAPTQPRLN